MSITSCETLKVKRVKDALCYPAIFKCDRRHLLGVHRALFAIPDGVDGFHRTLFVIPDGSDGFHRTFFVIPDGSDGFHRTFFAIPDGSDGFHCTFFAIPDVWIALWCGNNDLV